MAGRSQEAGSGVHRAALASSRTGLRVSADAIELPPLADSEQKRLRASIERHGVLEPVVVSSGPIHAGEVADGRARMQICAELGASCPKTEKAFFTESEFLLYRLSVNVHRRQLSPAQLIRIGQAIEPLERRAAAERRRQAPGRPRGEKSLPVERPEESGETRERVASLIGMKPATYSRGAKVLAEGSAELVARFDRGEESVNGAYRKLQAEKQQAQRDEIARQLERRPPPLPSGRFEVVVLDPPWPYPESMLPYPTMTLEEIAALPLREHLASDAVVWLWTTNRFLFDSARIARESWRLEYETTLTWDKERIGTGRPLRGQTEHCLLFRRGKPVFRDSATTLLRAKAREHSRKPDEFYALVERLCPGAKLEFFAREQRAGWQAWGAEPDRFRSPASASTKEEVAA